jgi:hypothetical protein
MTNENLKNLFMLHMYYKELSRLLNVFFSGDILVIHEEININYLKICAKISETLERSGCEQLKVHEWKPYSNLLVFDEYTFDDDWEMEKYPQVCSFLTEIENLFIVNGEKEFPLSIDDLKFINSIKMNTKAYAEYKKVHERKIFERFTQKSDNDKKPRTLSQTHEDILEIIFHAGNDMERRVLSHKDRDEPALRDVLLASLNSHKEIFSSGESFNKKGKTDILISSMNETIFIAECKIWRGKKSLQDAIAQLLSYLTWRDNKTALIIFYKDKNFSTSLKNIPEIVASFFQERDIKLHFEKEYKADVENVFRFICSHPEDINRGLVLTVFIFNLSVS